MFAIEVEFLMGRVVATRWDRRDRAEWPPHPQRLFSALVATHFDLALDRKTEAALKWLEALPPPDICADLAPSYRSTPTHWVPINDQALKGEKGNADFRHLLDRRDRQERFFPAVVPADPVVVYQWPDATGIDEHRGALTSLVEGLSYLGHSASPIRACMRDHAKPASLVPSAEGDYTLRVPGPGRFERLVQVHGLRVEEESAQPPLGRTQVYDLPDTTPRSVFSPSALVLAFEEGPRLSLDSTLPLMQHLRSAVLARIGDGAPEAVTGHSISGEASAEAHLAFAPLSFVDRKHADGSLKGAALLLPRSAGEQARKFVRRVLLDPWDLHLGLLGSITVRLIEGAAPELSSLRFSAYCRASADWATVTPVFLDRHPKKRLTVEQIIGDSCVRIGLPRPIYVHVGAVPVHRGAPPAREFRGKSRQTDQRVRHHVLLRFDRLVRGPVLLGAGRFVGLGLFLPTRGASN